MAELSLGIIVTICFTALFTILLIVIYCACRSRNKLYDHTCVALLHRDEVNQLETYKKKGKTKKDTVVEIRGYTKGSAQVDTKLAGQNQGKEARNTEGLINASKDKSGSTKLVKSEERRSFMKSKRSNNSKDYNQNLRKEMTTLNKNKEVKNERNADLKKKRSSKKDLKPYEVKVEVRNEQTLGASQVTLLRQSSGQFPEKCPLSIDDSGTTTKAANQDTKPSNDTRNLHYLHPKSVEEKTLTAKEKREKFSRSHSDSALKHSLDERDGGANPSYYMSPRSFDAQDGRPANEDYYVRPRSRGSGDWDKSQRSSSFYTTPRALEGHRDSHYVRPRSFEDNEKAKRRRSEENFEYYTRPRPQEKKEIVTDSYYVRPRSLEESEIERIRKNSEKHSYYVSPRGPGTRESYYAKPRSEETQERAKLDLKSYHTRPRSLGDVKNEIISSNYVVPRTFERVNSRERESYYVHPRTLEEKHTSSLNEDHYVSPRSFDNEDGRESSYVYARTLEMDRATRDLQSNYMIPQSFDQKDGASDSYYVHPRTLEEGRSTKHRESRNDMSRGADKRYSSTQNVRPQLASYRGKERRPRSADREDRELRETQRSDFQYMTTSKLDLKERERRKSVERYRVDRNEKRDKSRGKNEQNGTRENRNERRQSEERYQKHGKDEKNEEDFKQRERSRERKENEESKGRDLSNERDRYREMERERRREGSRERERRDERGKNRSDRNSESDRKEEEMKTKRQKSTERNRKDGGSNKEEKDNRLQRVVRERSSDRNEWARQEWKGVERRSNRGREIRERKKERKDDDHRSASLKRPDMEDQGHRLRLRSRSLENIPSSMERKKRQMHVIQRTKSWASNPSQRAESPPVPAQRIQLEFHPLSGDVTPLDSKSEVSTGPKNINVAENFQIESSPVLDYEWPTNTLRNEERKSGLQTDARQSSNLSTRRLVNEGIKDLYAQSSTSTRNHDDSNSWYDLQSHSKSPFYTTKNESKRSSASPNNLKFDSRRSSASYSAINDYSPRLENSGDYSVLSGSLMVEYEGDRFAKTQPRSGAYFSSQQGTQADFSTKSKSTQEVGNRQDDTFSKPKTIRTDVFTKPKATQTEVSSKPQGTQTETVISKQEQTLSELYYKAKDNYMDLRISNSSYDSQSSTDDYRVYQNEVRKLKGRPRSAGSRTLKKEASTSPLLEKRALSGRIIDLKTTMTEEQPRRTPTSSISSEDVDWHLYTIDGRKVIKPDVPTYGNKGLEWNSFTVSKENPQKNSVVMSHATTDAAAESSNTKNVSTQSRTPYMNDLFDRMDDDVFTQGTTVKRKDSRSKGSLRESLESRAKDPETKIPFNLLNTDLQRSSSQPLIFSFE